MVVRQRRRHGENEVLTNLCHRLVRELVELRNLLLELTLRWELDLLGFACLL